MSEQYRAELSPRGVIVLTLPCIAHGPEMIAIKASISLEAARSFYLDLRGALEKAGQMPKESAAQQKELL